MKIIVVQCSRYIGKDIMEEGPNVFPGIIFIFLDDVLCTVGGVSSYEICSSAESCRICVVQDR